MTGSGQLPVAGTNGMSETWAELMERKIRLPETMTKISQNKLFPPIFNFMYFLCCRLIETWVKREKSEHSQRRGFRQQCCRTDNVARVADSGHSRFSIGDWR